MFILPYLHTFAVLAFLYFMVFVLIKNPKSWINRSCAGLCASFAVWNFSFIFIHDIHAPKEIVKIVLDLCTPSWTAFGSLFLWMVIAVTNKSIKIRARWVFLTTIIPVLYFWHEQFAGRLIVDYVETYYGWRYVWSFLFPFYAYCVYYSVSILISMYLIIGFRIRTKNRIEQKQAMLIFYSMLLPLTLGTASDVFSAFLVKIVDIPQIASLTVLLWGTAIVYAIVRYKFLVLTPAMAADDIISTMADSLIFISPEAKILFVNPYTKQLLGHKDDLIGKDISEILDDKGSTILKKTVLGIEGLNGVGLEGALKKDLIKDLEVMYRTKEGEKIPISFSGSIMKDKEGILIGVVGIGRDMRETNKLIEKEKELARVAAVTRTERLKAEELSKAYAELKKTQTILVQSEKLRALGELGAGVAHELNSPLAGILCLLRSFMKTKKEGSSEFKDLKEMESGCEYMAKIIEDLSNFTKDTVSSYEKLNCNDVIESTLSLIMPEFNSRSIKVGKKYDENIPFITCDRRQVQQIILNVLANARDALKDKGILSITTRRVIEDGREYAEMDFTDNGCGMSEDVRKNIFEYFFTTKKEKQGVGLGLSIVKSIVDSYNGKIFVKSEVGKGTTFIIRIPAGA